MQKSLVKKGIVVGTIVLFVGAGVVPGLSVKDRDIIYVDDDNTSGPWDGTLEHPYQYIQDGVDAADSIDTVFVYNGTYYENVVIDKSINLIGEDRNTTIIDGGAVDNHDVVLVSVDGVSISEFMIRNSGSYYDDAGIKLFTNYNYVSDNIILTNTEGIWLDSSNENIMINNKINMNENAGIILWGSSNNTIMENSLNFNEQCDIQVWASSNNIISNNIINSTNYCGTYLYSSSNNIISSNTIQSTYGEGISLSATSDYNTLTGNNIISNNYGIKIYDSSNNNEIYHNNLINNTINAFDDGNNCWDSGYWSGGNYWSDYTGDDFYHGPGQNETGRDWRGDTPYNIAGGSNQDRYPLILQYESEPPFAIIEHPLDGLITSEHNVTIIGYITDNVGLVKSGTIYGSEWEGVMFWTESLPPYELTPKLDFDFIVELKPGWNEIGIHATDPSDNYGEDIVLVYYYPDIVYVDDDYSSSTQGWQQYCFDSIQDGIDAVAENGTVYIFNGTYYENVVVDKTINLIGENNENTIIDGGGIGNVVSIHSENVNVNGFKIQNSGGISSDAGIMIYSDSTNISDNNVSNNNRFGIFILNSNNNIISDNNIYFNIKDGIRFYNCNDNSVTNNTIISNGQHGVLFSYCNNNTISNNFISASSSVGIALGQHNYHNEFTKNIISDNFGGIDIGNTSENNILYHNNIINNNYQGLDKSINIWNNTYPIGGNFWDDYTGSDVNGDGIGETPYDIPGGSNQDLFPLIYPWGENPPVANFTYEIDEATVTFDATSSYDRDGEITTWLWDFGDGVEGAGEIVEHSYSEGGTYDVTLTVIDNDGYEGQITKSIEVEDGGYEFETLLIIGRITNLNAEGDFITFEAVNMRCITFFPFTLNPYTSGEKITILQDYIGVVGTRFIFALCGASI